MKIIHEIPIYGISYSKLEKKVDEYKKKVFNGRQIDEGIILNLLPQRVWKYNHIVGYITISKSNDDICFEAFLTDIKKYFWDSKRKHFLYDQGLSGYHFRIMQDDDNESIRLRINEILNAVIEEYIPSRYYVDRSAFDNTMEHIDYMKL